MATKQKTQAELLVEEAKRNGARLDLSFAGGTEDIDTLLEEEIQRNKVGLWFKLEDGQDATLRFFAWNEGARIRTHYKYNAERTKGIPRTVCPAMFGKECAYCRRADAETITRFEWIFQVYWYEVGRVLFFNYPDNRNSPIGQIMGIEKKLRKLGSTLRDADLQLTQNGSQTNRSFTPMLGERKPFDMALLKGVPPMTREQLVYTFVARVTPSLLGMADKNADEDEDVGIPELAELDVFGSGK